VAWDKYVQDGVLTKPQSDQLKKYDLCWKSPGDAAGACQDMLNSDGATIAEALILMLKTNYPNPEDVAYCLVLIDDMLENNRGNAAFFRELRTVNPFRKLLDLLAWEKDARVVRHGTKTCALLIYPGLGFKMDPVTDSHLFDLAQICRERLDPTRLVQPPAGSKLADEINTMVDMCSCLMIFLRQEKCRKLVNDQYNLHQTLSLLLDKARDVGNVQLLYQIGFCLWLLSYDPEIADAMTQTDVVVNMLKVMKSVSKEKVIRVCLACLRNLVGTEVGNETMIENDALKQLAVLRNRKWSDEEVREDLDYITDCLMRSVRVLSSLDIYSKEVASGKLEWTPVHSSETFWRDNVTKICPMGGSVDSAVELRALVSLLHNLMKKPSRDAEELTTLSVVCHDLGEFARFHPQGKKILQSDTWDGKSTKDQLMQMMSTPPDSNEDVSKQALTAIHKMMVTNWQFLEGRSS